jgi:archaellum component FlaC
MKGEIFIAISSVLLSAIIGLIGFWLRVAHKEIKEAIKRLTDYIYELNQAVKVLETHINKGIERGISTNKEKINEIHERLENVEKDNSKLKQLINPN